MGSMSDYELDDRMKSTIDEINQMLLDIKKRGTYYDAQVLEHIKNYVRIIVNAKKDEEN